MGRTWGWVCLERREEAYSGIWPIALGLGILGSGSPISYSGPLAIFVSFLAGLPADIDAPQQSCVLPALHHQTSLCRAVL